MSAWTCFELLLLEVRRSFSKVCHREWTTFGEKCQQESKTVLSDRWQHFHSAFASTSVSLLHRRAEQPLSGPVMLSALLTCFPCLPWRWRESMKCFVMEKHRGRAATVWQCGRGQGYFPERLSWVQGCRRASLLLCWPQLFPCLQRSLC